MSDISPVEAIALLSLMRLRDVTKRYREVQELLDPGKSAKHDDPLWRLYSALFEWVLNGRVDTILNFPSTDMEADIAAAIEVIKATVLFEKHLHSVHVRSLRTLSSGMIIIPLIVHGFGCI